MTDFRRPLVSVVVPALNEADNVPGLINRFTQFAVAHPGYDFELVVVDDGSTDGTADRVMELAPPDERVTVFRLARSFGSHYAISAGLPAASATARWCSGPTCRNPRRCSPSSWPAGRPAPRSSGVSGVRAPGARAHRNSPRSLLALFTRYAKLANYPPEGPSGVLIDRCVIDELAQLPERNRNVMALIAWLGFTQTRVDYDQVAAQARQVPVDPAQDDQAGRRLADPVLLDAAAGVHLRRHAVAAGGLALRGLPGRPGDAGCATTPAAGRRCWS